MSIQAASIVRQTMPLAGRRILITRPREQAKEFAMRLEALGAEAIVLPMITIKEPEHWNCVDRAIEHLSEYDWIVFTSGNAVTYFLQRVERRLPCVPKKLKICAVGQATADQLSAYHLRVDLIPEQSTADSVLDALPDELDGMKVLLPCGNLARQTLPDGLRRRGALVDRVIVYHTTPIKPMDDRLRQELLSQSVDMVTFTSPSTAESLTRWLGADPTNHRFLVASIGPTTSRMLVRLGLQVDIEASSATADALVEAIAAYFMHTER
jgi:uroporphyrinogen III methyltransferase/synthase